jgi:mRNA interferase RelE/StbE
VASYRLRIKASAAKEIEAIEPKKSRRQVVQRIRFLADEPRPPGCEKLSGAHDRYRMRQGSFRILYEIQDEVLIVFVVKVGNRREVYRDSS